MPKITVTLDTEQLYCPISYQLMNEPVATNCGHVFEKEKILQHLEHSQTCPCCRQTIMSLSDNISFIQGIIDRLLEQDPTLRSDRYITSRDIEQLINFITQNETARALSMLSSRPELTNIPLCYAEYTALMHFAKQGNLEGIQWFITHHPHALQQITSQGITALTLAGYFDHVDCYRALIMAGAPIHILSLNNRNAAELAEKNTRRVLDEPQVIHRIVKTCKTYNLKIVFGMIRVLKSSYCNSEKPNELLKNYYKEIQAHEFVDNHPLKLTCYQLSCLARTEALIEHFLTRRRPKVLFNYPWMKEDFEMRVDELKECIQYLKMNWSNDEYARINREYDLVIERLLEYEARSFYRLRTDTQHTPHNPG